MRMDVDLRGSLIVGHGHLRRAERSFGGGRAGLRLGPGRVRSAADGELVMAPVAGEA